MACLAAGMLSVVPFAAAQQTSDALAAALRKGVRMADAEIIEISGVVVGGGVLCPLLQLEDGRQFTLNGLRKIPEVGTRLTLRGVPVRMSTCQQGLAFRVVEIVE